MTNGGVVFFFTVTCPYCANSLPALADVAGDLAVHHVALAGVGLGAPSVVAEYVAANAIAWPVFAATDSDAARAFDVPRVPFLVVVSSELEVLGTVSGMLSQGRGGELEAMVLELLRKE